MHKIGIEENAKSVVQPQRRVNPIIQEVFKKEVVKFLDSRIFFLLVIALGCPHFMLC